MDGVAYYDSKQLNSTHLVSSHLATAAVRSAPHTASLTRSYWSFRRSRHRWTADIRAPTRCRNSESRQLGKIQQTSAENTYLYISTGKENHYQKACWENLFGDLCL